MKEYKCGGFNPVMAESFVDAGEKLAVRHAKNKWGMARAAVGASRVDCYSRDGRTAEVEVFVGKRLKSGAIDGVNVRFTIHSV